MSYDRIMWLKCKVCGEEVSLAGLDVSDFRYMNYKETRDPDVINKFLEVHSLSCENDKLCTDDYKKNRDVFILEYRDVFTDST